MIKLEDIIESEWSDAERQKNELLEHYRLGKPVDLTVVREATDERPVVDLESKRFPNWKFFLSRRFCVGGFLHQLSIGMSIQLYIQNFGESQIIFGSYFKKDNLDKSKRDEIINELRNYLREDAREQIKLCEEKKMSLLKVNIDTILSDHIIVEYKGLYGTMTNVDLFYADSLSGMKHYEDIEDGTMEVYVNLIDATGNVRFSETRLPELLNNRNYKGNEKVEKKWINEVAITDFEVGQEINGLIWQHMRNVGIFVICHTPDGKYIQSLIPQTALSEWKYEEWNQHYELGKEYPLVIRNINPESERLTLTIPGKEDFKYWEELKFESEASLVVNRDLIDEGQMVDIVLMSSIKEDDKHLYARTEFKEGDKFIGGYVNIEEDLPETLSHSSGIGKRGQKRRTVLNNIISYKPASDSSIQHISLPAIAHIEDDYYRFSVMDAVNKSIIENFSESDFKKEFRARKEEAEVVISWSNYSKDTDFVIFRWKNLFSFMHVDPDDKYLLTRGQDFYSGMKVKVWIKGINMDLSFDSDANNPYLSWQALNIKKGDLISCQGFWQGEFGKEEIFKTKYLGCSAFVMPGFHPDESKTQLAYTFRVVYFNRNARKLLLDYENRQFLLKEDIEDMNTVRSLNPVCPLGDNYFLMKDKLTSKFCIMQSTLAGSVLIHAIFNHYNLGEEQFQPLASFSCKAKDAFGNLYFEWNGNFRYSSGFSWPLQDLISNDTEVNEIPLKADNKGLFKRKGVDLEFVLYHGNKRQLCWPSEKKTGVFTGKFILKRVVVTPTGMTKYNVMYPVFVTNKDCNKPIRGNAIPLFTKEKTKYNLLKNGEQYLADMSNLYRGEIRIWANEEQYTYYYLKLKYIRYWFSSKSEVDSMTGGNKSLVKYEVNNINGKPINNFKRILSDNQKEHRKQLEFFKDEEISYWFQVITKFSPNDHNMNKDYGGFAGYILNYSKYNRDDIVVETIEGSNYCQLPFGEISEGEILPVYYHKDSNKFSATHSRGYIQNRYKKMCFKASVVELRENTIILHSGKQRYYVRLDRDINRMYLLSQFGLVVFPGKSVYIRPADDNNEWPKEDTEAIIIGVDN